MDSFEELLAESVEFHGDICPGLVLGVRMAMRGCRELGIENPREETKRLIVYVEIDRCAIDAIQVVTGCNLSRRTMKYVDYGKLEATFVDLHTRDMVRLVVGEGVQRKAALHHREEGWTKREAEAVAYKTMPDEELFYVERIAAPIPVKNMSGPPLH
jgi:formylmethanofuran dehydrogenase subunit E